MCIQFFDFWHQLLAQMVESFESSFVFTWNDRIVNKELDSIIVFLSFDKDVSNYCVSTGAATC